MCVNALRAALGGRLEPETVRSGATAVRVAAVFDNPSVRLRARRAELGIPDDDLITLSREVPVSGRATCRVDGALVSQAVRDNPALTLPLTNALSEITGTSSLRLARNAPSNTLPAGDNPVASGCHMADCTQMDSTHASVNPGGNGLYR